MSRCPRNSRRGFLRTLLAGAAVVPGLAACSVFDDDEKPILAGHRIPVVSGRNGLIVQKTSDPLTPITIPASFQSVDWPISGRVPSHVSTNYAWNGLKERWSKSIGHSISEPDFLAFAALGSNGRGVIQATPVIHQGRIFTMDAIGNVHGYTWPAMNHLWHFNPKSHKLQSSNIGGGLGAAGDTLYIVDGISETVAVEAATGAVKWRMNVGTPGRSAPTIVDGRLFFGTIDERFFALDATSGHQLWDYNASPADTVMFGQPAPAVTDGVVLTGFGSGDLVALRAESGEVVWSDTLGNPGGQSTVLDFACVRSMPVIAGGTAYAMSVARMMVAIDMRSGRRLWERAIAGQNPILCAGDWLFIISMDDQVACLDRITGQVRWITQLRQYIRVDARKDGVTWTGPALAGGKLICISTLPENGIVTLDPVTGKILSLDKMPAETTVEPIFSDGQMLVIDNRGVLTSYG
ncbi:PQQ-binding-like beta-propeller repeat protein [Acetobacter oeni]|uniref:PQQ-binding-like beta-propeller repeat protein n=1 Tax=Acetobacter oeni TaxID=304077 RepID=UPI0011BD8698|nr:PQQ-binding-like beta-propeller repeat protein [Acetobacter oeni]MBB3883847.1 outer membrane protein assembly factor BamB [Acetobacter oeni]NHO19774.1 PQQ-binding-like beta-propeller repeat protein [Acetobacter oeni]